MTNYKQHYFLKLNSPRPGFLSDMTDEEKLTMAAHISYWAPHIESGLALVIGPVLDPSEPFGVAIIRVDNEEQVNQLVANDPATAIARYDVFPMRANTRY